MQRARVRLEDILDEIEGIRSITAGLRFSYFEGTGQLSGQPSTDC
jgi:uncharacterized protein with HEPN domain